MGFSDFDYGFAVDLLDLADRCLQSDSSEGKVLWGHARSCPWGFHEPRVNPWPRFPPKKMTHSSALVLERVRKVPDVT